MPIPSLTIIGETINDSVPSTKQLFDAGNIDGLLELARFQDEKGAAYIDVNVGARLAGVHGRNGPQDPGRDGQAALDRHARSANRPCRAGGLRSGPGRRPAADPQFHQCLADGHVRSVRDPAVPAHPLGFRAGDRRRVEALPHGGRDLSRGPVHRRDLQGPLPRREQRRLHHRSAASPPSAATRRAISIA